MWNIHVISRLSGLVRQSGSISKSDLRRPTFDPIGACITVLVFGFIVERSEHEPRSSVRNSGIAPELVEDVDAKKRARKPEAGTDEGEGLGGLPLATPAMLGDRGPVEHAAAAVLSVDVVKILNQGAEGSEPSEADDEVGRVVEHRVGEGDHPDQGKDDGDSSDDDGVDLATMRWSASVKEVGDKAQDDLQA